MLLYFAGLPSGPKVRDFGSVVLFVGEARDGKDLLRDGLRTKGEIVSRAVEGPNNNRQVATSRPFTFVSIESRAWLCFTSSDESPNQSPPIDTAEEAMIYANWGVANARRVLRLQEAAHHTKSV